ncbi:SMP-30/gluconolactonase/LRE family protein [Fretibacter rubidus]|uniref:SMP-30/gluconolactonase/LRE family protein n=1 Tax=Fretibacter rubidus TaxID=570162 RepID=UPI00352B7CC0
MTITRILAATLAAFLISACDSAVAPDGGESPTAVSVKDAPTSAPASSVTAHPIATPSGIGTITRLLGAADAVIPQGAEIERLSPDMFWWSEGPVWVADVREPSGGTLYFTDVPQNTLYQFTDAGGVTEFLKPSGFDAAASPNIDMSIFREAGANGLINGGDDMLIMGDHGNRAVMALRLSDKTKTVLANNYQGRKFNSPNDVVLAQNGALYFTDPPYGLKGMNTSPAKEIPFNGVYRRAPDGTISVIDKSLSFPNGIILSPDERTLYVAVSDPAAAKIYRYDLNASGQPTSRNVLFDFTDLVGDAAPGLPDGMAMSEDGHLFATGPGGVHVFAPDRTRIALISTGTAAANCTFGGAAGDQLYITSGAFLARVKLSVKGLGL